MLNISVRPLVLLGLLVGLFSIDHAAALTPTRLHCEHDAQPFGMDVPAPRLSWLLDSDRRGAAQSAYQVLVASSPEILARDKGDLWDSGWVKSSGNTQVVYAGAPLESARKVFWKVRVSDEAGKNSPWSPPESWTMGLLSDADWAPARWITSKTPFPTTRFRRDFEVKPDLRRAVIFVCGLGEYELTLDGKKVGEDLLTPGWTNYRKTCLYDTYDITDALRTGRSHALGVLLGNSMYHVEKKKGRYSKFAGSFGPQKLIAQLRLEYTDGKTEIIPTDDTWWTARGPLTYSQVYGGEDYDARLAETGWDTFGHNADHWAPAVVTEGPGGALRGYSYAAPPIRAIESLKPASIKKIAPGVFVYDLGQNASMMPRIAVTGPAGSTVKIIPAEVLGADGRVDQGVSGAPAWWQYTLAGKGRETWFPKFYYRGARYLQVELQPAYPGGELPGVHSLEGVVVHSSARPIGRFASSNELFNRIHTLIRWAQRSNIVSVMTDCPHREKLGWLEEDHLNGPALRYEFDLDRMFTKIMNDMSDAQLEDGMVPSIAPEYPKFTGGFRDSPEWGSALLLVAWQQYEFTGDTSLLRRYYENMKSYVAYLGTKSKDHIVDHGLGDWYDIGPKRPGEAQLTPKALTATAFYYIDSDILAKTARILGKPADAAKYETLTRQIGDAFNQRFLNKNDGTYSTNSQTANSLPVRLNLAPSATRDAAIQAIIKDVRDRGNALTAGDVGYRYLLRALADSGNSDVIFDMNNQSEKPGYGYQLKMGATSLTEAWNAERRSSQNHFMLGQLNEWFYHDLAGIQPDPSGPGFRKIIIRPAIVGDLTWVKASYESVQGLVASAWQKDGRRLSMEVTIPANTTATIHVPTSNPAAVTEDGQPAATAPGVKFLRAENGSAIFAVTSGTYKFSSVL